MSAFDALRMKEFHLQSPVDPAALAGLELGDVVFLHGVLFTGREGLYRRWLDEKCDPPVPLREISNVNFHCSPAAVRNADGSYLLKSVTGTASFRFGKWFDEFFRRSGVRVIIGKGGLTSEDYRKWFVPHGARYLTTVGYGLGATYGRAVRRVREVHWLDELGIAQAVWVLEAEALGPFLVESDGEGRSLFELANAAINQRIGSAYEGLKEPVLRRFGEETDRRHEVI
jgi:L(+)-tartrate dehydratase beta subunit